MAWWEVFTSAPKAIEAAADSVTTVVKGGMNMLDKAFYTDQERAEAVQKMNAMWLEVTRLFVGDNSISARARRGIAYIVTGYYVGAIAMAMGVYPVNKDWSMFIINTLKDMDLNYAFLGVMTLFYGPYMLGKYLKGTPGTLGECDPKK